MRPRQEWVKYGVAIYIHQLDLNLTIANISCRLFSRYNFPLPSPTTELGTWSSLASFTPPPLAGASWTFRQEFILEARSCEIFVFTLAKKYGTKNPRTNENHIANIYRDIAGLVNFVLKNEFSPCHSEAVNKQENQLHNQSLICR